MFWDCMNFLSENYSTSSGFGLWLESDMAPTQPDWLDRLACEWHERARETDHDGLFRAKRVPQAFVQATSIDFGSSHQWRRVLRNGFRSPHAGLGSRGLLRHGRLPLRA